MHSKFDWPLIYSLLTQMPVISKSISNHISFWTDFSCTNRITSIIQCLYLIFSLVVPEVHSSVSTSCHKPSIIDWIERDAINRIKYGIPSLFLLVALECDNSFLNRQQSTGANMPFTLRLKAEMLALPSNEAIPKLVHLWFIATDCICENLPKSFESIKVRLFWLLISIISTFSLNVPATRVGKVKSLANTLFSALIERTGVLFPCCQICIIGQQAVEITEFIPGTQCKELIGAPCLPTSAICPLPKSYNLIEPSINPTQIWLPMSFQVHFKAAQLNLVEFF